MEKSNRNTQGGEIGKYLKLAYLPAGHLDFLQHENIISVETFRSALISTV